MNLAWRAHQPSGHLVDKDGLRAVADPEIQLGWCPGSQDFLNEVLSGKGSSTVKSSVRISKTLIAIVTSLICASLHADGYHVILKLRCLNHGPYQL